MPVTPATYIYIFIQKIFFFEHLITTPQGYAPPLEMDATLDWMRRLSSTLIRPAHPAVPLPEKRGWLTLNGKKFYFVLRSGRLAFFPNESATTGGKRFNLAECHVKKVVSPFGLLIEITREKKVRPL